MNENELLLRPALIFAFFKSLQWLSLGLIFLFLAWRLSPDFMFFSLGSTGFALYRFLHIRSSRYIITPEVIRIKRGIFSKRTDQVEMYRIKDYIITQPFLLQLFRLMDLTLKSTDPENPVIWLRGIPESDIVDTIREYVQHARMNNQICEFN